MRNSFQLMINPGKSIELIVRKVRSAELFMKASYIREGGLKSGKIVRYFHESFNAPMKR